MKLGPSKKKTQPKTKKITRLILRGEIDAIVDAAVNIVVAAARMRELADESLAAARGAETEPAVKRHAKAYAAFDSIVVDVFEIVKVFDVKGLKP